MSDPLSRRTFVLRCSAAALAVPLAASSARRAAAAAPSLTGVGVRPRSDWAEGLPVPGPLAEEAPGDVRVLVVHHSASPNGYAAEDVPGVLRGFHSAHTGAKGWPDIAYNFLVDAFGTVWEGRAGSLAGPVQPDATGGSQGFSQICCFVGDHTQEAPTAEAQRSMGLLLAALAGRYGVDPRGTTTFVSRGSDKWPAGVPVTTSAIAGHRDVSLTSCPGDAAYALVQTSLRAGVAATLAARAAASVTRSPVPSAASRAPTATPSTSAARASRSAEAAGAQDGRGAGPSTAEWVAGGAVVSGLAAALARRLRRTAAEGRPPG